MFLGLALLTLAGSARAQNEAAPPVIPDTAPPALDANGNPVAAPEAAPAPAPVPASVGTPDEYVLRPITLAAGEVQIKVPVVINLSKSLVGKPIYVPLEVRYGLTDTLELTLFHDTGLCLTGKSKGCEKVYNDVGLGVTASLMKNNGIELAAIGALQLSRISDPMWAQLDVGVAFKYTGAPLMVMAAPQVEIGLNKRDAGNVKQFIMVPVQAAFQAAPNLAIFLETGIMGPTDHFGDLYTVPVGIGANFLLQHGLDLGAEFILPMVAKGSAYSGVGAADTRAVMVYAAWRNL
jgi:hypothetical protein